jgi:hypothetical protein
MSFMRRVCAVAVGVAILAAANGKSEAAMVFTSINRTISATPNSDTNTTTGNYANVVFANPATALASQASDIQADSILATLFVSKFIPSAAVATSTLSVAFTLTSEHTFSLASLLASTGAGATSAALTAITGTISPTGSPLTVPQGVSLFSGTLSAGDYLLTATAGTTGTATGTATTSFSFEVLETPEPSTFAMLGTAAALGGVLAARRRRKSTDASLAV